VPPSNITIRQPAAPQDRAIERDADKARGEEAAAGVYQAAAQRLGEAEEAMGPTQSLHERIAAAKDKSLSNKEKGRD
jgi:hypothetical protein